MHKNFHARDVVDLDRQTVGIRHAELIAAQGDVHLSLCDRHHLFRRSFGHFCRSRTHLRGSEERTNAQ